MVMIYEPKPEISGTPTIGYTGIIKYATLIVLYFFTFMTYYMFNVGFQYLFYYNYICICVFVLNLRLPQL